jgi:four helix bundle protein
LPVGSARVAGTARDALIGPFGLRPGGGTGPIRQSRLFPRGRIHGRSYFHRRRRMSFYDFTEMPVWKSAFDMLLKVYQITRQFPLEERFGLTSDMRRAANSVVHNIAEGFGRYEPKDKTRFYKISRGGAYELFSQTLAGHALGYIRDEKVKEELIQSLKSIIGELNAIIKTLES